MTVWTWRKALGVGATTEEGTTKLRGRWAPETVQSDEARERMLAVSDSQELRAKIAAFGPSGKVMLAVARSGHRRYNAARARTGAVRLRPPVMPSPAR